MAVAEDGSWKQQLTYVPEVVLKKRKHKEESIALTRKTQLESARFGSFNKRRKVEDIKRPEHFVLEYRNKLDLVRMKRRVKTKLPLLADSKLLFIVRVMGTFDVENAGCFLIRKNEMHPSTRKVLNNLKLGKVFHAVFAKATPGVVRMLQRAQPYVTYGYPNLKNVKDLIYKKGHGKIAKQRVPLIDNNIVEKALGNYNILCLEDIVHEVANVGPHFKEVINFLGPFELTKPKDGLKEDKTLFKDGGDTGNRKDMINDLINKMN